MRIHVARNAFVVLMSVCLSGCYSGGKWSMPKLAFWKKSPFKRSSPETEAPAAEIAASTPKMPSPGAGYGPVASSSANQAPAGNYPTTAASYTTPGYRTSQLPYPATQPPRSAVSGGYQQPYMPAQQGPYGVSGSTAPATASPYPSSGPYSATTTAGRGSYPGSGSAAGSSSYVPAPTAPPYANPVRSSPPYGTGSTSYGSNPAAGAPYGSGDSSYRYGSPTHYGDNATGAGYKTSSTTGTGSRYTASSSRGSYGGTADARFGDSSRFSNTRPYGSGGGSGYGAMPGAGTSDRYGYAEGERYSSSHGRTSGENPSAAASRYGGSGTSGTRASDLPPVSKAGPGGGAYRPSTPYNPPASNYRPGETGYNPSGVPPYAAPGSSYQSPATTGNSAEPPPYRPGGTSDFVPRTNNPTSSPSRSSGYPGTGSGIAPVSYPPTGGSGY